MTSTIKKAVNLSGSKGDLGFRDENDSVKGPHQGGRLASPKKSGPTSTLDPKKAIKCLVGLLDGSENTFLVNVCFL